MSAATASLTPPLPPLRTLGHRPWPQLDERDREALLAALEGR